MGRLTDKVTIITGAASGQGAAEARLFSKEGARVVIADIDESGADLARTLGENASFVRHDVSKAESWDSLVRQTIDQFGGVHVLINNAGIYRTVPLQQTDEAMMERFYRVNQLSVFLGIKAVIETMTQMGRGSIVNVSSGAGMRGVPSMFAYAASKWAVRGMTKCAALDLASHGIRVNTIIPGVIDTPMIAENSMETLAMFKSMIPFKRLGAPEEIAQAALFLASDDASYVTGAELVVCGGLNT